MARDIPASVRLPPQLPSPAQLRVTGDAVLTLTTRRGFATSGQGAYWPSPISDRRQPAVRGRDIGACTTAVPPIATTPNLIRKPAAARSAGSRPRCWLLNHLHA